MSASIAKIRVTTTVEVLGLGDETIAIVTLVDAGSSGNPSWAGRVMQRLAERNSDNLRLMLGMRFGEVDKQWRDSTPSVT